MADDLAASSSADDLFAVCPALRKRAYATSTAAYSAAFDEHKGGDDGPLPLFPPPVVDLSLIHI